jgi:hypothetical protein
MGIITIGPAFEYFAKIIDGILGLSSLQSIQHASHHLICVVSWRESFGSPFLRSGTQIGYARSIGKQGQ